MYFVKYENPEGEHIEVAKAEAPKQRTFAIRIRYLLIHAINCVYTPPTWPRLVHQASTG